MKFGKVYTLHGRHHIGFDDDNGYAMANVSEHKDGTWHISWQKQYLNWVALGTYDTPLEAVCALVCCDLPNWGSYEFAKRKADAMGVRLLMAIPDGWRVTGGTTAPAGTAWIAKGSLFWMSNGKERYEHALLYLGM